MRDQPASKDSNALRALPSSFGFIFILFRLRLVRFFNSLLLRSSRFKTRLVSNSKAKGPSVWLTIVMALGLVMFLFVAHYRVQERMDARFIRQQKESEFDRSTRVHQQNLANGTSPNTPSATISEDGDAGEIVIPLPPAPGFQVPHMYLEAMSTFLVLMALSGLFLTLGLSDLAKPEWDLEWLSTLPIHRYVLLASRVIERTFFNPAIQLAILPPVSLLLWKSGNSIPFAIGLSWLATLPLMFLLANFQTICDTGLRMHRGPAFLKNLQSLFNLAGVIPIYLLLFNGFGLPRIFIWLRAIAGDRLLKTPMGLLIESLLTTGNRWLAFRPYTLDCLLLGAFGFAFLIWQSRDGFEINGGREVASLKSNIAARKTGASWTDRLSPLVLREWRMLTRDTTYLTQTLLVPILIIAIQVSNMLGSQGAAALNSAQLCAIAFGLASYSLLFTSVQSVTSEGPALWIIYTLPDGLKRLLRAKVRNWTVLAFVMAMSLVAFGEIMQPRWDLITIGRIVLVAVGIPVFAMIATSFGVFSFTGASTETVRRGLMKLKPAYVYFYMLLAAVYGSCFYIQTIYPVFVIAILMIFAAIGIWQSALRELPYLMDNSASPSAQIRTVHGVIGVLLFFACEVMTLLLLEPWLQSDPRSTVAEIVVTSSALSGCVVAIVSLMIFYRRKGLLFQWLKIFRIKKADRWVNLLDGLWGGIGALMFAGLFLWAEPLMGAWGKEAAKHAEIALFQHPLPLAMTLAWIIVVPFSFELLFTGLVLRTLRDREQNRETGKWPESLLILNGGLLFALVQPEFSFLPLLAMGAISGFLYLRTRSLLPGLVAHIVFNAGVILLLPNLIAG